MAKQGLEFDNLVRSLEALKRIEDSEVLLSLLGKLNLERLDVVTEAWFLKRRLCFFGIDIVMRMKFKAIIKMCQLTH